MGKQNVVHLCNGILPNLKKEGNSDTCYNGMNLEDIRLSEISQIQKGKMIPLICATQSQQVHRDGKLNGGCQGLGEEGMET